MELIEYVFGCHYDVALICMWVIDLGCNLSILSFYVCWDLRLGATLTGRYRIYYT